MPENRIKTTKNRGNAVISTLPRKAQREGFEPSETSHNPHKQAISSNLFHISFHVIKKKAMPDRSQTPPQQEENRHSDSTVLPLP